MMMDRNSFDKYRDVFNDVIGQDDRVAYDIEEAEKIFNKLS